MSRIVQIQIDNFRGIKSLDLGLDPNQRVICLIGRGDSCKSNVLEAILAALYPAHNRTFTDSDFYRCETNNPISIKLTLIDIPEEFFDERKFGLLIKGYDRTQRRVIDDVIGETQTLVPALTVKLKVASDLEPKWTIATERNWQETEIKATDRAKLGGFLISDCLERQFTWSRGSPLYSLLKSIAADHKSIEQAELLLAFRNAARNNTDSFDNLSPVTGEITAECQQIGANVGKLSSAFDLRDLVVRDGGNCATHR